MVRPPCCDKPNVRKGNWSEEEDAKVLAYVSKNETGNWTTVAKKTGLKRSGKSCRLNRHESFTHHEEELIIRLHAAIGSRWTIIAQQLPGRSDNDVKNYWNTKLKKKLSEMGIDPITHKPFSQILADYGNIGGLPKSKTRIGTLNRDFKNAFMLESEQSPIPPEKNPNFNSHLTTPKINPTQESFLSNNNLLAQLQTVMLVTKASNCTKQDTIQPQFFSECSASSLKSSSSSCSSSSENEVRPPPSFSWRDFLLEDAFLPEKAREQCDLEEFSPKGSSLQSEMKTEVKQNFKAVKEMERDIPIKGLRTLATSDSSFVEAMIDQENDMFLEFPDLLEEPFFY